MAVSVTEVSKSVHVREIPDGVYEGFWSGYVVRFRVGGDSYEARVDVGVRGLNVPCKVTITLGEILID